MLFEIETRPPPEGSVGGLEGCRTAAGGCFSGVVMSKASVLPTLLLSLMLKLLLFDWILLRVSLVLCLVFELKAGGLEHLAVLNCGLDDAGVLVILCMGCCP